MTYIYMYFWRGDDWPSGD